MPLDAAVKVADYLERTEGWTGADIEALARKAGVRAIKRVYKSASSTEKMTITQKDFEDSLVEIALSSGKSLPLPEEKNSEKREKKSVKI